jgi:hypothetical protein
MKSTLLRFRLSLGFFLFGLIASGLTAFPLLFELKILAGLFPVSAGETSGLHFWLNHVATGLEDTYGRYPWLAYGTDWLAFAHLMIAVFFIGPLIDPLSGRWTLISGLIACLAIFPLALICGAIRDIPFYWRLIDCSFGFFGLFPLLYCLKLQHEMEADA